MPNLVITNRCNLRCPFCFAREYRADDTAASAATMSLAEFRQQVDLAGADTVRFCGGEPTLHPHFVEMLALALARPQGRAFLMTNGLWSESLRSHVRQLARAQKARLTYLVNVLEPELYSGRERECLADTLRAMDADRVTLGVTIYRPGFDWEPLVALAERFGISHLRYSIAAPTVTDPRSWNIEPARDFPALAAIVVALTREAHRRKLRIQSDCGYIPPCMFTKEELDVLRDGASGEAPLEFRCHGPVDVGPDGEAWRCYGLYSLLRAKVGDFADLGRVATHFEQQTDLLAEHLLFDACGDCRLRGNICGGGCFAFRLVRALRTAAQASGVSVDDDAELAAAVPRVNADNLKVIEHAGRALVMLREADGTWARLPLSALDARIVLACDGTRTVGELMVAVGHEQGLTLDSVARLIRQLVTQAGIALEPRRR
jgi:radical SAM protein with 4Fe4S-binding SPASM domain